MTSAIKEWKGTGINWKVIDNGVTELVTFEGLCNEGQEMEHCVASYAHWCASGAYLAFQYQWKMKEQHLAFPELSIM